MPASRTPGAVLEKTVLESFPALSRNLPVLAGRRVVHGLDAHDRPFHQHDYPSSGPHSCSGAQRTLPATTPRFRDERVRVPCQHTTFSRYIKCSHSFGTFVLSAFRNAVVVVVQHFETRW